MSYNYDEFRYNESKYPAYYSGIKYPTYCYGEKLPYRGGLTCSKPDSRKKKEGGENSKQRIEKGRKNEMSFTGMIVCTDGVLAFGDSRSTSIDIFNTPQKLNDETEKVFSFDDFIMTASGRNVVELCRKEDGDKEEDTTILLSEFVRKCRNRCRTPYDFIDIFMDEVVQSGPYYFIFGIKSNNKYDIIAFEIINGNINYHSKQKELYANMHDTTAVYSREFDELIEKKKADGIHMDADTARNEIKRLLTAAIHYVDERYAYNVVGLPLQFAILK